MSRQIAEAIRIQHTKDIILNSACEYLQNCIIRLTVNEEVWERTVREREERKRQRRRKLISLKSQKKKLSICQEEEGPRTGQKRKRGKACMEEDIPRIVESEHHEHV